jgi:hypothetical protein
VLSHETNFSELYLVAHLRGFQLLTVNLEELLLFAKHNELPG